ncbi:MAG: multiheme c-type cytochrome [Campylobacterota bacterium]|nr:multiheme c-type cytochrome [Campylobacterota bacterium]
MKYTRFKTLALILSTSALLALSGCGSNDTDNDGDVGDNEPQAGELGYQTQLPDGTVDYVDYTGETRNAVATVAESEYHTGLGFGNTLFDSADKKCQNCHNELYDTWKSSMHGKSWTDPIFQSKFQDFLRTHINKIEEDKTAIGGIVYTEAMIPKVAQTCIKCHAPGAYYAGDFKAVLTTLKENATTADLNASKINDQYNLVSSVSTYDPTQEAAVVAVSHTNGKLYQLTYQIGHQANNEGINCAFCHSIETPRLMRTVADGAMDGEMYTLAKDMRVGPHGPIKAPAGSTLAYDVNASNPDMNKFFRLWGPEKYAAYHATPKDNFDVNKSVDGRYTMASKDMNGTDGKVHFTGGPFYGPYGVTGTSNENETDETDRAAHVNPHYDKDGNNHFGESGKGLCLSCHQRSAGATVPSGEDGAGNFMELCSTQIAVSTGGDNGSEDTLSSPKCQKCHMERIEGTVLHKWARPDQKWTLADNDHLTAEFNPDDTTVPAGENPVRDGWLNSHAFLGASKTGHKTSATAKIQSGFEGSISTSISGDTLTVRTTFTNKTAHMFPGAHPMRRALSRVIVTDGTGAMINVTNSTGTSTFTDIENMVQPLQDKVLHESALSPVSVNENGSASMTFPGKVADLDGSAVTSQKFDGTPVTIPGTDYTLADQTVSPSGTTTGTVSNAAIVNSADPSNFTRVYGHETGKKYDLDQNSSTPSVFVVRPGFDSNMVESDNRLSPNETETYRLTYDITGKTGVSATYKIYYMQKGANGKFIVDPATGFLDQAASDAKKLLVTEVGSYTQEVN